MHRQCSSDARELPHTVCGLAAPCVHFCVFGYKLVERGGLSPRLKPYPLGPTCRRVLWCTVPLKP